MSEKVYVDVEIVEVTEAPTTKNDKFSAMCKVKGKDEAVKCVGGAEKASCIKAGATVRASWSEEWKNYWVVGESKPRGGGGGGRPAYVPKYEDTREGFIAKQRCIMAQNALTNAVAFMQGLPADKAAETYTAAGAMKLASAFFHALWKDATDGLAEAKADKQAEA